MQKLAVYEQFGVDEYWIVDPRAGSVEVFRRGKKGLKLAKTYKENDSLSTLLLPGFVLPIKNLFD